MVFDKKTQEFEQDRLNHVTDQIRLQIENGRNVADKLKKDVVDVQKSMWDHINPTPRDMDDLANIWQYQTDLVREGRKAIFLSTQVGKLEKMLKNPYFARIDFKEYRDGSEDRDCSEVRDEAGDGSRNEDSSEAGDEVGDGSVELIYIGISNLKDKVTSEFLVFDWRAPVSGMFYDYEPGRAGYLCPAGRIEGELLLKRQYRLWNGEIQFMFDSSIAINDDILQEILGKSADSRMKTIVTSIQREQNSVIRDDAHKLLIVNGPAGSGKTSIALHRAAYLIYRYRESITSDNIVIFSPNSIFNDYISNVLPELGEENINRTTFIEYAQKTLGPDLQLEDASRQLEYLLRNGKGGDEGGDSSHKWNQGGDVSQFYRGKEDCSQIHSGKRDSSQLYINNDKKADTTEYRLNNEVENNDWTCRDSSQFQVRIDGIKYKSSVDIITELRRYALYIEESRRFEEVSFNGECIETGEEIAQYFREELKFLPVAKRLEKIRNRLTAKLDILMRKRIEEVVIEVAATGEFPNEAEIRGRSIFIVRSEAEPARNRIAAMTKLNLLECYKNFFVYEGKARCAITESKQVIRLKDIADYTCEALDHNKVFYEDIGPLLLLNGLLFGFPKMNGIRHVIIDEVQDYTPVQFELLKLLFVHCSMTLLGDPNQAISPLVHPCSNKSIIGILESDASVTVQLKKSYRSTRQIAEFCKNLIHEGKDTDYVNREGDLPEIICTANQGTLYAMAAEDIKKLMEKGMKSIAVITKTEFECRVVYNRLSEHIELSLITADKQEFFTGTAIIPSYLSKGLEFDAVLVLCMDATEYGQQEELRLVYTVCTRALHQLHIYCPGGVPDFVKGLGSEFYKIVT